MIMLFSSDNDGSEVISIPCKKHTLMHERGGDIQRAKHWMLTEVQ